MSPTIQLPLGTTEIALVVGDGTNDSEPGTLTVTVIGRYFSSENEIVAFQINGTWDLTLLDSLPGL